MIGIGARVSRSDLHRFQLLILRQVDRLTHPKVSPALTIIDRETAQRFANLIGFDGPHAGGITLPGGSASNSTSMIIAKNTLFPETKTHGNGNKRFVVFTSTHGHYSIEKAAILLGLGSGAVWEVAVDEQGRMVTSGMHRID